MFLTGMLSAGEIVQFNIATQYASKSNVGTAISITNCGVSSLRFLLVTAIGFLLDYLIPNLRYVDGIPQYPMYVWNKLVFIFPLSFALAFLLNAIRNYRETGSVV